jgi:hypothetical protein
MMELNAVRGGQVSVEGRTQQKETTAFSLAMTVCVALKSTTLPR